MNHLKKFEEMDYLSSLKKQKELENEVNKGKLAEVESSRNSDHLRKLSSEIQQKSKFNSNFDERKELTHQVVQSIIQSELNKEDFLNFKQDLKDLLNRYPLNKLPKSGSSIYPLDNLPKVGIRQ